MRSIAAMMFLIFGACVQSGAPEDLALVVDATADPVRFSWAEDQPVHALDVVECRDDCDNFVCEEGVLVFSSSQEMWSVGYAQGGDSPAPYWKDAPEILPTVTYGQEVAGDQRMLSAYPLEPNVTYAAQIELIGCTPWDDSDTECNTLIGSGCALFQVGE